ncbi:hypothetical protein M885DRAFT_610247 [Pelagophyceae sp. CCMP2097]|nr:hypothetical protein M885DRAFT_610247 [Pelagophyceae sp. CCMP2097]
MSVRWFRCGASSPQLVHLTTSAALEEIGECRLVVVGEVHGEARQVAVQRTIQRAMAQRRPLYLVLEHFSLDSQQLLDHYKRGGLDFDALTAEYNDRHYEGHDLVPYAALLDDAKRGSNISLHAGFVPRPLAQFCVSDRASALGFAKARGWVRADEDLAESEGHYGVFEGYITGAAGETPTGQFRRIFPAQLLKDAACAHAISSLFAGRGGADADADDADADANGASDAGVGVGAAAARDEATGVLAIVGRGHMGHGFGVPERLRLPPGVRPLCIYPREACDARAPNPPGDLVFDFGPEDSSLDDSV